MTFPPDNAEKVNLAERRAPASFWQKVRIEHPAGCWLWTGTIDANGYGRFNGRYAHIIAWEDSQLPVPERDHLCRTPNCVNPLHMEPVTHKINTLRSTNPLAENARKTQCLHGHAFDDANTYWHGGWRQCRACNRRRQLAFKARRLAGAA